jgi:hypothetical protein
VVLLRRSSNVPLSSVLLSSVPLSKAQRRRPLLAM